MTLVLILILPFPLLLLFIIILGPWVSRFRRENKVILTRLTIFLIWGKKVSDILFI